jgi:hypothetical protein
MQENNQINQYVKILIFNPLFNKCNSTISYNLMNQSVKNIRQPVKDQIWDQVVAATSRQLKNN